MHKVEVIDLLENRNFKEFFEKVRSTDGQIQEFSCSCVSYLQNLSNGIFPSPMLCIMTEAAVLSKNANSFKELISQSEFDLNDCNKHFDSPERSIILGRAFRDLVQKYNSKIAEK